MKPQPSPQPTESSEADGLGGRVTMRRKGCAEKQMARKTIFHCLVARHCPLPTLAHLSQGPILIRPWACEKVPQEPQSVRQGGGWVLAAEMVLPMHELRLPCPWAPGTNLLTHREAGEGLPLALWRALVFA